MSPGRLRLFWSLPKPAAVTLRSSQSTFFRPFAKRLPLST